MVLASLVLASLTLWASASLWLLSLLLSLQLPLPLLLQLLLTSVSLFLQDPSHVGLVLLLLATLLGLCLQLSLLDLVQRVVD